MFPHNTYVKRYSRSGSGTDEGNVIKVGPHAEANELRSIIAPRHQCLNTSALFIAHPPLTYIDWRSVYAYSLRMNLWGTQMNGSECWKYSSGGSKKCLWQEGNICWIDFHVVRVSKSSWTAFFLSGASFHCASLAFKKGKRTSALSIWIYRNIIP